MRSNFTSEDEFIKAIAPAVQKACKRYGYLPSVLIAQACHENGYGIRAYWDNPGIEQLLEHNNMVGQKAELLTSSWADKSVWPGKSFAKQTPEEYSGRMVTITDKFRIFDDIEQSFCDFLLFLKFASNYGKGGVPKYGDEVLAIKDPEQLIRTVAGRGYATGSTYPSAVMKIINRHDLTKYDNLTLITPSDYIPDSIRHLYTGSSGGSTATKTSTSATKKLEDRTITDITGRNSAPRGRGSNPVSYIVVHYLGVPNADNPDLYGGGYGGHYNIQRDGRIFKAADPAKYVVWHCGGGLQGSGGHAFYQKCTNFNSIGIECGVCYGGSSKVGDGDDNLWFFTEETQESLVWLVSRLMDEFGIGIDHVIRHYDVTGKICPNPYIKNNHYMTNWTWDEFKANLQQYRKDGTITLPSGWSGSAGGSATPAAKSYLQKGDKGDDVKAMQTLLIRCGYGCGSSGADGDFGPATLEALKKFQEAAGLSVDGLYGPKSKAALEKAAADKTDDAGTVFMGVDYSPVYNYQYYRKKYADLQKAFGTDRKKYFEHFCQFGMKEGRQGASAFSVQKYKNRYEDLRKAFGENLPEYYKHYCQYGKKEGRKAT